MVGGAKDVAVEIGAELVRVCGGGQIGPAVVRVVFVQPAQAARVSAQRGFCHHVNVDGGQEGVVGCVGRSQWGIDHGLGGDDHPPGGAGQHHIVPGTGRDRVAPAVGLQGVENGHIGPDRLGHHHLFAGLEGVVLDEQVGPVCQHIGAQQPTHGNKREAHRSSLDHAVQHPSSAVLHVDQTGPHGALKVGRRPVGAEGAGAGLVAVDEAGADQQIGVQSAAGQGHQFEATDSGV